MTTICQLSHSHLLATWLSGRKSTTSCLQRWWSNHMPSALAQSEGKKGPRADRIIEKQLFHLTEVTRKSPWTCPFFKVRKVAKRVLPEFFKISARISHQKNDPNYPPIFEGFLALFLGKRRTLKIHQKSDPLQGDFWQTEKEMPEITSVVKQFVLVPTADLDRPLSTLWKNIV